MWAYIPQRRNSTLVRVLGFLIIQVFGLGKIFLSDNNPKKIMKRRAIFRLVDITEWKKEIDIKINKPPIIMGDLFSDPRILWEEYD